MCSEPGMTPALAPLVVRASVDEERAVALGSKGFLWPEPLEAAP